MGSEQGIKFFPVSSSPASPTAAAFLQLLHQLLAPFRQSRRHLSWLLTNLSQSLQTNPSKWVSWPQHLPSLSSTCLLHPGFPVSPGVCSSQFFLVLVHSWVIVTPGQKLLMIKLQQFAPSKNCSAILQFHSVLLLLLLHVQVLLVAVNRVGDFSWGSPKPMVTLPPPVRQYKLNQRERLVLYSCISTAGPKVGLQQGLDHHKMLMLWLFRCY